MALEVRIEVEGRDGVRSFDDTVRVGRTPHNDVVVDELSCPDSGSCDGGVVSISDGDLYIDGKIERKPWHAQRELWFPVHDSDVHEKWTVEKAAWDLRRAKDRWAPSESGGFRFSAGDGSALRSIFPFCVRGKVSISTNQFHMFDIHVFM